MTKKLSIDYAKYNGILRADVVRVYDLIPFFKKEEIDYDEYGNIFIGFNEDAIGLPILVAHTDNVLGADKEPVFDLAKRRIKGVKDGIGFDDKAGIMAIIELWHMFKEQKFRIIFPANEETGGDGSSMIEAAKYADAKWILELDRRGDRDIIQTSGTTRLCSDEFAKKFVELGFKIETGTFTDLNVFKPECDYINMANLSIGYYNPHTDNEYLDTVDFEKIIMKVARFIEADYDFEPDEPDKFDTSSITNYEFNKGKCTFCGGDCGSAFIFNRYGERFCCAECMNEFEDEMWKNN